MVFEDLGRFSRELRFERTANLDICLQLLHGEVGVQRSVLQPVHIDDVSRDMKVVIVVFLVKNDEEKVETRHDWRRNVHIVS